MLGCLRLANAMRSCGASAFVRLLGFGAPAMPRVFPLNQPETGSLRKERALVSYESTPAQSGARFV